ncbi:MAG: hypothetical protein D6820_06865 [Lentisphaerae bacterium]|nr:MAG: hypothetical protein D6820_06865 [Lentisphaerota bacterium]
MTSSPNILILHTDQQSLWSVSAYNPAGPVQTPHIDRLAGEGVKFEQFFTNSAVCTPSRGCFLTGRYPHAHGAFTNNVPLNPDEKTFASVLSAHGYHCGYIGKWHLDGPRRPGWVNPLRCFGFTDNHYMFNRGHWKTMFEVKGIEDPCVGFEIGDEQSYTTDWLTNKGIDFIRNHRQDRPFCLMISYPDPHGPYSVRPPYDTMYSPEDMEIPATFGERNGPSWVRQQQERNLAHDNPEERLKRHRAAYCGEVKLIDDNIGRILAFLEEQEILDDTIVIFTTDHGDYLGEHSLYGKNAMYHSVYHIPLLIRYPRRLPAGTKVNDIVTTVDFHATLLELVGLPPSPRHQGSSALPAMVSGAEAPSSPQTAWLHHPTHRLAGLIDNTYLFAVSAGGEMLLFDRIKDPLETNNLVHQSQYQPFIQDCLRRLYRHHSDVSSPAAAWLDDILQSQ